LYTGNIPITDVNINMGFEIIGEITSVETIAVGRSIREVARLQKVYGPGRWRKLKGMATVAQYVVCVKNEGYSASLELRKIYYVVPDIQAAEHQMLRVIDESGEDYLYPASYFVPIELPQAVEEAFALAS
jgi:hypothetical protein